jgi:hypothetical protein
LGSTAAVDLCDIVVMWFEFAYLGSLSKTVPAAWLLAAAGVPFVDRLFHEVSSQKQSAVDVLTKWAHQLVSRTDVSVSGGVITKEVLATVFGVSTNLLKDFPDGVLCELENRLSAMATEALPWHVSVHPRDECFDALSKWLRGGWASEMPDIAASRVLPRVKPVSLSDLLEFEKAAKTFLALDLRRLILEVGDVGEALFAVKLMSQCNVIPGQWLWSGDGNASVDPDSPLCWVSLGERCSLMWFTRVVVSNALLFFALCV